MKLNSILATIREKHPDETIIFLVETMERGDLSARKQLADKICTLPAKLPPLMLLEVSRWGINDDMSQCPEIKSLAS